MKDESTERDSRSENCGRCRELNEELSAYGDMLQTDPPEAVGGSLKCLDSLMDIPQDGLPLENCVMCEYPTTGAFNKEGIKKVRNVLGLGLGLYEISENVDRTFGGMVRRGKRLAAERKRSTINEAVRRFRDAGNVVVLTGAGISKESGIPTFRGEEGYWKEGSENYTPYEIATNKFFKRNPGVVWNWYHYRRGMCRRAEPNPAHLAIREMEQALGDRFTLITQNVDGLHLRAGNSAENTLQIHGNMHYMRCGDPLLCGKPNTIIEVPDEPAEEDLKCGECGSYMRPNVLWFDECYSQMLFRSEDAEERASNADFLLIVGTAGVLGFPEYLAAQAKENGAYIVDVNPEDNGLSYLADLKVRDRAAAAVPVFWKMARN